MAAQAPLQLGLAGLLGLSSVSGMAFLVGCWLGGEAVTSMLCLNCCCGRTVAQSLHLRIYGRNGQLHRGPTSLTDLATKPTWTREPRWWQQSYSQRRGGVAGAACCVVACWVPATCFFSHIWNRLIFGNWAADASKADHRATRTETTEG